MFSFHKPRVYRSTEGCCICRAKSSSSRFTDSRKYEEDSMKCFALKYPRHGEICNACVLLVKRFKRLPVGSTRHWGHVVDARAGPGIKSLTKHKKGRDDSETPAPSSSSNSTRRASNSKSLVPEKFSKIFKKSKKSKADAGTCLERKADGSKRSAVPGSKSWSDQHLFAGTVDSNDSDYEDVGEGGDVYDSKRVNVNASSSNVQFQTQTRASANRASRTVTSNASHNQRKSPQIAGSKRRKCKLPIRNRSTLKFVNQKTQFFEGVEWQESKTCCGKVYMCSSVDGSILIDNEKLKNYPEHKRSEIAQIETTASTAKEELPSTSQKTIVTTLPAVAVAQMSAPAVTNVCPPPLPNPVNTVKPNYTPVLKKHHLFFKRQSESFPHVDLAVNNNVINSSNKTESLAAATTTPVIIKSSSTTSTLNHSGSMPHPTAMSNGSNANNVVSTPMPLAVNTTNISAISNISPSSATSTSVSVQMPRHSTAKVTTISPPLPTTNIVGGNRLLHKIKAGKIFKHSLEKISVAATATPAATATVSTAKAGDFQDIKPAMRNLTKSYVVSKPTTTGVSSQPNTQYYPIGTSATASNANALPNSASSSSTAPKFSDNSSDSGFDENLQERKSASPLQEDIEKKLAARAAIGNVHTMFLAGGVQILGQHQNLMLTGNEVAAKILQNRKQQMAMMATTNGGAMQQHLQQQQQQQQQSTVNVSRIGAGTTSLKISPVNPATIAAISVGGNAVGSSAHSKQASATLTTSRAIYNNNTIQHENGVTTIVPASSLAASNQTAAMNALAPSTVTITPAPTLQLGTSSSKKLTTSGVGVNLINTSGNNQSNILHTVSSSPGTHLLNHGNGTLLQQAHHLQQQQQQPLQHHNTTASNLNQKIILLKTSGANKYNNLGNTSNSSSSLSSVKLPNGTATSGGGVCKN